MPAHTATARTATAQTQASRTMTAAAPRPVAAAMPGSARPASSNTRSLELSAEAVWGMIAFATLPVISSFGAIYAAWQARHLPTDAPWDDVDVTVIGGAGV